MKEDSRPIEESYSAVAEGPPSFDMQTVRETSFEKRRGISKVEVRSGYIQIHVVGLSEPIMENRLRVLDLIAAEGVSIDFLKLTQNGLSFMATETNAPVVSTTLERLGVDFDVLENRHIVLVHAVNMRDEAGLIADVMAHAIASGVHLEHVTDMHNRMLMVVGANESATLAEALESLGGGI